MNIDHLKEIPAPVLFNVWKHHAGAIRQRLQSIRREGSAALLDLPHRLLVIGTEVMDLYTGTLSPMQIAEWIITALQANDTLPPDRYKAWLSANHGYRVLTSPDDDTQWVVRLGDESDRYVHVHPARRSPNTRRVRANLLKTAIMVHAHAAIHGGNAYDLAQINAVRKAFLALSPIERLSGEDGLGALLTELRIRA